MERGSGYVIVYCISIHTVRGDGDITLTGVKEAVKISIHTVRGDGDALSYCGVVKATKFQSTPSAGTVTVVANKHKERNGYFNPHRPRGR